jgi:hypothetical protein
MEGRKGFPAGDEKPEPAPQSVREYDRTRELKIEGPKGFERLYTLIGGAGQH